jgi:acetyl-CoA carboxylase carboxyl transferase subunit beta
MFFFSREKPKIKQKSAKKDSFSGWLKCTQCHELIHAQELKDNLNCCPKCDYHYRLSARDRIALLADAGSFEELFDHVRPCDSLQFIDTESYKERLVKAQSKTQLSDALVAGKARLNDIPCLLTVMDFEFMGGSMGCVVGERLTLAIEASIETRLPLILVAASGGARMQESTLSLMQMAKTSSALAWMSEEKIPYICLLTNPTTGGVSASFAMLGDLILAEPQALICFAGPRVIEQTIGRELPAEAQKSEYLLKHGMIDAIVKRHEMKEKLSKYLGYLQPLSKP